MPLLSSGRRLLIATYNYTKKKIERKRTEHAATDHIGDAARGADDHLAALFEERHRLAHVRTADTAVARDL